VAEGALPLFSRWHRSGNFLEPLDPSELVGSHPSGGSATPWHLAASRDPPHVRGPGSARPPKSGPRGPGWPMDRFSVGKPKLLASPTADARPCSSAWGKR